MNRRRFIKTGLIFVPTIFSAGLQGSVRLADLLPGTYNWMKRVTAAGGNYTSLSVVANDIVGKISLPITTKLLRWNTYAGADLTACSIPIGNAVGNAADTLNNFVGGDYSQSTGLTGNGTTKYVSTGFIPNTHWVFDNDCAMGVYARTSNSNLETAIGTFVGTTIAAMSASQSGLTSSGFFFSQVAGEFATGSDTNGIGHYLVSRNASNSLVLYKNGSSLFSTATPAGTRTALNTEIIVHGININSVASQLSSRAYGGYHIARGLSASEVAIAYQAFHAGNRVLGRSV